MLYCTLLQCNDSTVSVLCVVEEICAFSIVLAPSNFSTAIGLDTLRKKLQALVLVLFYSLLQALARSATSLDDSGTVRVGSGTNKYEQRGVGGATYTQGSLFLLLSWTHRLCIDSRGLREGSVKL